MPQEKEGYIMTQLDNEFFEEYKHLERLCSDMYSCRDGIRQYLEDMECQFSEGKKRFLTGHRTIENCEGCDGLEIPWRTM